MLCVAGSVITSGAEAGWAGLPINFFEFDGAALNPVPSPAKGTHIGVTPKPSTLAILRLKAFKAARFSVPP